MGPPDMRAGNERFSAFRGCACRTRRVSGRMAIASGSGAKHLRFGGDWLVRRLEDPHTKWLGLGSGRCRCPLSATKTAAPASTAEMTRRSASANPLEFGLSGFMSAPDRQPLHPHGTLVAPGLPRERTAGIEREPIHRQRLVERGDEELAPRGLGAIVEAGLDLERATAAHQPDRLAIANAELPSHPRD